VELFAFVSWCLVTVVAVTLFWPVNIPLMALAYKVRHGGKPIDMDGREFWIRCTLAALGLTGMTLLTLGLVYVLVRRAELPAGAIHLTLLLAYLPAAVGFVFWVFGLEDMVQAVGVFLLYILLPGFPLLLLGRFAGWWEMLRQSRPWLLPPAGGILP
jgi:hypothetical protein